jgi:multidrug efflux pump subunit AcrA (membrane-fusion protein)
VPKTTQRFLHRTWVRRALPVGVAAVVVIAGTAVTRVNANANAVDTYRTTTVSTGSVEQRLNVTGSVQKVDQVSQSFPVAGTVTSVPVAVGDTVTAGQTLATMNPLPLQRALTAAQASLAQAKATLESDQTPTTTKTSTSGTTGTTGTTGAAAVSTVASAQTAAPAVTPRVASPSRRSGSGADPSLARAQQLATSAQRAITWHRRAPARRPLAVRPPQEQPPQQHRLRRPTRRSRRASGRFGPRPPNNRSRQTSRHSPAPRALS